MGPGLHIMDPQLKISTAHLVSEGAPVSVLSWRLILWLLDTRPYPISFVTPQKMGKLPTAQLCSGCRWVVTFCDPNNVDP
jgi:hypothetical protein